MRPVAATGEEEAGVEEATIKAGSWERTAGRMI
jgi:hypothetical protein